MTNNTKYKRSDFEIMAPVGSFESLAAALRAGTDAIYFGIKGLNMRSRSSVNFTADDMADIVRKCRPFGVKTYLTVNTVIYDSDIPTMQAIIDRAQQAGITAVIATDPATIQYARSKGVEVHISTQVNITNTQAVKHYAQYADVMVLARELNLEQVAAIHSEIISKPILGPAGKPIRLEMFCHGALCMAVSGKCYMSLHELNSSANRGACAQICRRAYTVTDKETGAQLDIENQYVMSPRDLKTIHFLNKMADAGVRVFKIEGRARGPEYVYETVRAYSEALQAITDGTYSAEKIQDWDTRLRKIFNRDFWDGYYLGQRLGEWSEKYGSSATRTKFYAGKCRRYFPKIGVAEFKLEAAALTPGEEVLVIGPTTGSLQFTAGELRLDRDPEPRIAKGEIFSMKTPAKVRPGDRLYIWHKLKP